MQRKTVKAVPAVSRDAYKRYKQYLQDKKVPKDKHLFIRDKILKIMRMIFASIGELVVERRAGVLIKGFGYFYISLPPVKKSFTLINRGQKKRKLYSFYTDHRVYTFAFLPKPGGPFRNWSMTGTAARIIKRSLNHKIVKEKKHYKAYPFSLKNLI